MMTASTTRSLQTATLYRLLAAAFAYPDVEFESALASGAYSAAIRSTETGIGDPDVTDAANRLYDAIAGLQGVDITVEEEFTALFERKVPCSPYASRYLVPSALYRSRVLADVSGVYSALGLQISRSRPDLPDHIGAQLEFLGVAEAASLAAEERADIERSENIRLIRSTFGQENVVTWLPVFREKLEEHARLAFYPALTDLTLALLRTEFDVPVRPQPGPLVNAEVDNVIDEDNGTASEFDCGPA
jgi:TorA maturation chaperone TorD